MARNCSILPRLDVTYAEETITLSDGAQVALRHPTYRAADLGYGPLHPNAMLSPRVAPQMIGLGLLETIPATDILALADPNDENGNAITGRPHIVWSAEFNQSMLGRFGLKAGHPTILQQSAAACPGDIRISTDLFPTGAGDCTIAQVSCRSAPHGDGDARNSEIDT